MCNNVPNVYVWEIKNFVIKSDIFRGFFICKNILKKSRVTMTTTLNFMFEKHNGFVSKARFLVIL
jgi:hypothetical protein